MKKIVDKNEIIALVLMIVYCYKNIGNFSRNYASILNRFHFDAVEDAAIARFFWQGWQINETSDKPVLTRPSLFNNVKVLPFLAQE